MKLAANSFLRSCALISGFIAVAALLIPTTAAARVPCGAGTEGADGPRRHRQDPDLDLDQLVAELQRSRQRLRALSQRDERREHHQRVVYLQRSRLRHELHARSRRL